MTCAEVGVKIPCVPASPGSIGPRACLASLDDHRHGRLTGQWVRLDASPQDVEFAARAVLRRARAAVQGLGIFDIEGASLDDPSIRALLAPVLGVAGRRLLDS